MVLIGATPDDAGGLLLWESVGRRPFWLAAAAWLVLAAGVLANALVMLWRRRQEPGVPKSLDLMEAWIAATLRRLRRLRAATRFAIPLTLAVAALATELIRRERWHEAAAGRATVASLVNVPATAGVALVLLAALAVRVDAERSQAGRLILATSGGVAGATYGAGGR